MLENLNLCDPNAQLTNELPDKNGFLRSSTLVRICQNVKQFMWQNKSVSKDILSHFRSAYPLYMKTNMVRNGQDGAVHILLKEIFNSSYLTSTNKLDVNRVVKSPAFPIKLILRPPLNLKGLLKSSRNYEQKRSWSKCTYCPESQNCQL